MRWVTGCLVPLLAACAAPAVDVRYVNFWQSFGPPGGGPVPVYSADLSPPGGSSMTLKDGRRFEPPMVTVMQTSPDGTRFTDARSLTALDTAHLRSLASKTLATGPMRKNCLVVDNIGELKIGERTTGGVHSYTGGVVCYNPIASELIRRITCKFADDCDAGGSTIARKVQ